MRPAARGASGDQAAIQDAAKKAYQAIADSKIDDLWTLVQSKYDHKLRPEKLRPGETGPKVSVAFDGNVKVLRTGKKDAVVGANFFKPDSSDIAGFRGQPPRPLHGQRARQLENRRTRQKGSRLRRRQRRMVSLGVVHLLPEQGDGVSAQSFQQQDRMRRHRGVQGVVGSD